MTWKDDYLDASFRGVRFYVQSASTKGGHRVAEHDFPGIDETDVEQLGGISKRFTLSAYLIGDDYNRQREDFEAALDSKGPGILVHPYRGTANVKVAGQWDCSETADESGMCRYSIPFVKVAPVQAAQAKVDTRANARNVKDAAMTAAAENFENEFDILSKPLNAVRDARNAFSGALTAIEAAKRVSSTNAQLQREIENCRGRLISLQADVEYVTQSFIDTIDFGNDVRTDGRSRFLELRQIAAFAAESFGETIDAVNDATYPSRQAVEYVVQLATIAQVGVFPDVEFTTAEDAEELHRDIIKALDALSESPNVGDELFARVCTPSQFDCPLELFRLVCTAQRDGEEG